MYTCSIHAILVRASFDFIQILFGRTEIGSNIKTYDNDEGLSPRRYLTFDRQTVEYIITADIVTTDITPLDSTVCFRSTANLAQTFSVNHKQVALRSAEPLC